MFLSKFLGIDLSKAGVFDALLDKDSNFFINVVRLRESGVPEFIEAYSQMNLFFEEIAILLDNADEPDAKKDKIYREARKRFTFHEVNGINLGFAESRWGAGWGTLHQTLFCMMPIRL